MARNPRDDGAAVTPRFPKQHNKDNIIKVQHQQSITSTSQNLFK